MKKLLLIQLISVLALSYISAQTDKEHIQTYNLIESNENKSIEDVCSPHSQQGSASLQYYTTQFIMTSFVWHGYACQYMTKDISRGAYLYVRNFANGNANDYLDWNNTWANINDRSGTTALWCIEQTYDYFYSTFQRNSWNNSGGQVNVYVDVYGTNATSCGLQYGDNSTWCNDAIYLGIPGGDYLNNNPTTLDVIAHEFTHGIAQSEVNLSTAGEAGAINESFADIFGYMVDYYAKINFNTSLQPNYTIGEECHYSNKLRYFNDPHAGGQADTYGINDPYWFDFTGCSTPTDGNDQCGVHKNCGVQNYWFYLLCEGGNDINANGNDYCVIPIGRDKAARIAYYTLTEKITNSNPTFIQIRNWSIEYAQDYYGYNSNEVAQVTNAWYAVGVGSAFSGNIEYNNLTVFGTQTISSNNAVVFNNFNTTPTSNFTVTSNTRITMNQNSKAISGSYFHAYIETQCPVELKNMVTDYYSDNINKQVSMITKDYNIDGIKISVYPNPSNGNFIIETSIDSESDMKNLDSKQKVIEIFDILGNIVYSSNSFESIIPVNIGTQLTGVYLIKIKIDNKQFKQGIIIN